MHDTLSKPPAPPRPGFILAATILASSLSFVDGSVINVGLPSIGGALGGGAAGLQWVINAYLLPLSALVLLGGALGDRYGRGPVFALGIALFGVASAACALAPTLGGLVGARVLQGVAAALLMPNSLAILGDTFEGPARGRAVGIWAAAAAATAGCGPVLGGWLIETVGWRAIFAINLPLAAAALLLALRFVPSRRIGEAVRLDVGGALLATAGLGAVTFGLVVGAGPAGWSGSALGILGAGALLLAGFVAWEGRRGAAAMMPLTLFASPVFTGLTLLTLFLYAALGALMVLLPFGMMEAGGATAIEAGAALLPITVLLATLSSVFGEWAGRLGPRVMLTAGPATIGCGLLLMLRVGIDTSYWTGPFPALIVVGVGLACAVAPLTAAVLTSVPPRLAGTASGFNNATARTAGLIATACLGRAMASRGPELVAACHTVAILAAGACFVAAAAGLLAPGRLRS